MLLLLRELAVVKVWTLGLVSKHCNTIFAHFYYLLPCCFYIFRLQKPISTIRIALVSPSLRRTSAPIQFCIGCVGDTRDSLLFGCRVAWERLSSSYTSYGLINLRSSTWGKFSTVLQTSALGGPTTSIRRRLCSRHQALFWRRCRGGEGTGTHTPAMKLFSSVIAEEVSAWRYIFRSCNRVF